MVHDDAVLALTVLYRTCAYRITRVTTQHPPPLWAELLSRARRAAYNPGHIVTYVDHLFHHSRPVKYKSVLYTICSSKRSLNLCRRVVDPNLQADTITSCAGSVCCTQHRSPTQDTRRYVRAHADHVASTPATLPIFRSWRSPPPPLPVCGEKRGGSDETTPWHTAPPFLPCRFLKK